MYEDDHGKRQTQLLDTRTYGREVIPQLATPTNISFAKTKFVYRNRNGVTGLETVKTNQTKRIVVCVT
ncbi:hypothetical protein M8J76_001418 [Diaphorina citri]|nr:hypothetical protein M8J76_001418 [Diaphorina citri]